MTDKTPAEVLFAQAAAATEERIKELLAQVPTKRANKTRSGRMGRKQWNGAQTIKRAGGTADLMDAMLDTTAYRDLCNVVPRNTGLNPDGTPFRSPSGQRSSGAQRGV